MILLLKYFVVVSLNKKYKSYSFDYICYRTIKVRDEVINNISEMTRLFFLLARQFFSA